MATGDDRQRLWGQYYTAPELADLVLGFCLRRPGDSLLDPSCGRGAFLARAARYQRWLANGGVAVPGGGIWGVEIDEGAAAAAQQVAKPADGSIRVLTRDFFSLRPGGELPADFDCVVGNPPYTRSEWMGRAGSDSDYKALLAKSSDADLEMAGRAELSRRSGLYAYFVVHAAKFLRPRGRLGYVISNAWLDVAYGTELKRFILDHFKIVAIIESAAERWFGRAAVNTCILILEKCADRGARMQHRVRFARLRRSLRELISAGASDARRSAQVEGIVARLLPATSRLQGEFPVRVVSQRELDADEKWGPFLRAPDVYFHIQREERRCRLGEVAQIRRGLTTGANRFFYLDQAQSDVWQVEPEFLRPLLKSPKEVERIRVLAHELERKVLVVDRQPTASEAPNLMRYVAWGEGERFDRRMTCARRPCWYRLPSVDRDQGGANRLAWPKGIWNRHFVLQLDPQVVVDQQFYELQVAPELCEALAAILNSSWVAFQAELRGRSNFGEGVLWLAGYELSQAWVVDVTQLMAAEKEALAAALAPLVSEPIRPLAEQVLQPAQQALDAIVFDLLGIVPGDAAAVVDAAVELASLRIERAHAGSLDAS